MQGLFWEILEEKGALIWLLDKWGSILLFDLLAGEICKGLEKVIRGGGVACFNASVFILSTASLRF